MRGAVEQGAAWQAKGDQMTRPHCFHAWLPNVPPREVMAADREDARAVAARRFRWDVAEVLVRYYVTRHLNDTGEHIREGMRRVREDAAAVAER